jgi:hypothetical protein
LKTSSWTVWFLQWNTSAEETTSRSSFCLLLIMHLVIPYTFRWLSH